MAQDETKNQNNSDSLLDDNYRKPGEPINIERLIEIADRLDILEQQNRDNEKLAPYGHP
ncbi:MAG: hypothetical protein AAB588_06305 [Patescibacteria group bacterium]